MSDLSNQLWKAAQRANLSQARPYDHALVAGAMKDAGENGVELWSYQIIARNNKGIVGRTQGQYLVVDGELWSLELGPMKRASFAQLTENRETFLKLLYEEAGYGVCTFTSSRAPYSIEQAKQNYNKNEPGKFEKDVKKFELALNINQKSRRISP